jgi:hypothetical protein
MVPTVRQEAALELASVLGPGPADGHASRPHGPIRVEVPRLRDMADADPDDDARPLTVQELKDSVRRSTVLALDD